MNQGSVQKQIDPDDKLTPEQITNWRRVLCMTLGPYALVAPEEQIQMMRDKMQKRVYDMERESS